MGKSKWKIRFQISYQHILKSFTGGFGPEQTRTAQSTPDEYHTPDAVLLPFNREHPEVPAAIADPPFQLEGNIRRDDRITLLTGKNTLGI